MPTESKNELREELSEVRKAVSGSYPGRPFLVSSVPALRLEKQRNLVHAVAVPLPAASVCNASPTEFLTNFSGALAIRKP